MYSLNHCGNVGAQHANQHVRYSSLSCAIGVDYFDKTLDHSTNPCPGREEGSHPFDHPFVQVDFRSMKG